MRTPLVLKDTSHLGLIPDPALVTLFRDQRHHIEVIQKTIKKLNEKGTNPESDSVTSGIHHDNLSVMVTQLTAVVMEQVKLHEASTLQSVADMHEAMGITVPSPKRKKHEEGAKENGKPVLQPPQKRQKQQV